MRGKFGGACLRLFFWGGVIREEHPKRALRAQNRWRVRRDNTHRASIPTFRYSPLFSVILRYAAPELSGGITPLSTHASGMANSRSDIRLSRAAWLLREGFRRRILSFSEAHFSRARQSCIGANIIEGCIDHQFRAATPDFSCECSNFIDFSARAGDINARWATWQESGNWRDEFHWFI